jgi:hypothetical protein
MKKLFPFLLVLLASACAHAAECLVTDTILGPDGRAVSGIKVEFTAVAPQSVNNALIHQKAVFAKTDGSGNILSPQGSVGVSFTQGAVVKVVSADLNLHGQKILIPNTTSATLRALIANYMAQATLPAVDDATDLVMGVADSGLVDWLTGTTIADAMVLLNQAAGTGGGSISDGDKGDIVVSSGGAVWSIDTGVATTAGRSLMGAADAAAQRTALGLGTLATQSGTFSGTSSGTNTGDQTITLTSDVTGSGTGSFATTIAADAVTNAKAANMAASRFKCRVTASTGDPEDCTGTQATTLLDSFTSSLKGLVPSSGGGTTNYLRADGTWTAPSASVTFASVSAALSAANTAIDFNGQRLANMAEQPVADTDAASRGFVWGRGGVHFVVQVATTANITLSGEQTIDGVLTSAYGVLVKNQSTASQNGLYTSGSGAWTRRADMDISSEFIGLVNVQEGTTQADTLWTVANNLTAGITVGSTSITFTQISSSGGGLSDGDKGDITVASSGADWQIDSGVVGSTEIANGSVALADMANLSQDQVIGRVTASTGVPETFTCTAAARTILDDTTVGAIKTTLGAENALTFSTGLTRSTDTITVATDGVSNTMLANMAAHTFKCNNTGSTGDPVDCTATQATAELNAMVGDSGSGGTKGLAPAPSSGDAAAGKFLKADGTWAVPAGGGGSSVLWDKHMAADMFLPVESWTGSVHSAVTAAWEFQNQVNVRAFDQTTAEGVGFEIFVPDTGTTIAAIIDLAAATSGFTTSNGVQLTLCCRTKYGTGSFTCVDGTNFTMSDVATKQRKTQSWSISSFSLGDEDVYQCELARDVADSDDTLTRDLRMIDSYWSVTP